MMLTPEQLEGIRVRVMATTPGPWVQGYISCEQVSDGSMVDRPSGSPIPVGRCRKCMSEPHACTMRGRNSYGVFHVCQSSRMRDHNFWWAPVYSISTGDVVAGNYDYEEGGIVTKADSDFFVRAPEDVLCLLAEVERLQGELSSTQRAHDCAIATAYESGYRTGQEAMRERAATLCDIAGGSGSREVRWSPEVRAAQDEADRLARDIRALEVE